MTFDDSMGQEVRSAAARAVPEFSPDGVERLEARSGKADVYRVRGSGRDRSLILKLQDHRVAVLEERVYRDVLARLPVPAIRCHGCVASRDPSKAWLVLDHADGVPFDRHSSRHATSLARWLGAVHSAAATVGGPTDFPDHGAAYWRGVIAEAQRTLWVGIENHVVTRQDRDALVSLTETFDQVLGTWPTAEHSMGLYPATLTHGDLVAQNIVMGDGVPWQQPWVHDWGGAGWGSPMIDLLRVDLAAYVGSLGPRWPRLSRPTVRTLRALGVLCWTAWVLIEEREKLSSPWPHRAAAKVPGYLRGLAGTCPVSPADPVSVAGAAW